MQNINSRSKIFLIFSLITFYGTFLTSIGTFISIGRSYNGLKWVAFALSLKTLFGVIAPKLITKFTFSVGIFRSLIVSQLLGIPILLLLAFSFYINSPYLTLIVVMISGLPSLILNIIGPPLLREYSDNQDTFKRIQGLYQTAYGFGMLFAGALTPVLLDKISIYGLYTIDAISFFISILFLFKFKHVLFEKVEIRQHLETVEKTTSINNNEINLTRAISISLFVISSCLFIGLIPAVASSGKIFFINVSNNFVEQLWSVESLSGILIGFFYYRLKWFRQSKIASYLPIFSTMPFVVFNFSLENTVIILCFLCFACLFSLGINRYRDDFIESHLNLESRIYANSFYQTLLNILRTFAPILILLIHEVYSDTVDFFNASIVLQLFFVLVLLVFSSGKLRFGYQELLSVLSKFIVVFCFLVVFFVGFFLKIKLENYEKSQVQVWIDSLPKMTLEHLIDFDYNPINQKVRYLEKTDLFKSVWLYDKLGNSIAGFPVTEPPFDDKTLRINIIDEGGSVWGVVRYVPEFNAYSKMFFYPFLFISLLILIISILFANTIEKFSRAVQSKIQLEDEKQSALVQISQQVAHDIRSPLSALEMISTSMDFSKNINHEKVLRSAINRIKDIANDLLSKDVGLNTSNILEETSSDRILILPVLEAVISETRIRYQHNEVLLIKLDIQNGAELSTALMSKNVFSRIISNLLNNSIDAKKSNYIEITIRLEYQNNDISISVIDNGVGIPEVVINNLGTRGLTVGKNNFDGSGSGLGLSYVVNEIRKHNGKIIAQNISNGTCIQLLLPRQELPVWLQTEIYAKQPVIFVICDDDQVVHDLWVEKFSKYNVNFEIKNFLTMDSLKSDYTNLYSRESNKIFLIDYELDNKSSNGLDLINSLGLNDSDTNQQAFLVTSHYDNELIKLCARTNIKIIPKFFLNSVQIKFI